MTYQSHCLARGSGCQHLPSWWSPLLCSGSGWTAEQHLCHYLKEKANKGIRDESNSCLWRYYKASMSAHHWNSIYLLLIAVFIYSFIYNTTCRTTFFYVVYRLPLATIAHVGLCHHCLNHQIAALIYKVFIFLLLNNLCNDGNCAMRWASLTIKMVDERKNWGHALLSYLTPRTENTNLTLHPIIDKSIW